MSKLLAPGLMAEKVEWGVVCTDTNVKKRNKISKKGKCEEK
jgi:hypothetical protein